MVDIAREAKVTRITVSRALSRPDLVAPQTLARIREAIEKTGYIPDQIARSMKSRHSRIVSLVTPPHMSGVYGTILTRLSEELFSNGLIVNLFPVHELPGHQEAVLRELAGWRPAAIVTFGIHLSEESRDTLNSAQVPVIELLSYSDEARGSVVGYDQREASRLLTEHLLDRGYRKICYVHAMRAGSAVTSERLGGFVDAIRGRGGSLRLAPPEGRNEVEQAAISSLTAGAITGIELKSEVTLHNGFGLMGELAAWPVRPDAVLFASDVVAVGALQYCLAHGLVLQHDVALCAFDGIELTSVVRPHLTCLDFPLERVIKEGARQILKQVRDHSTSAERVRIGVKVLHREST